VPASRAGEDILLEKSTPGRLRTVSGVAYGDDTASPLPAIVQLVGPDGENIGQAVNASEDGVFVFENVEPLGRMQAVAIAPGYRKSVSGTFSLESGSLKGLVLYLALEQPSYSYSLSFDEGGAISGTVPQKERFYPATSTVSVPANLGGLAKDGCSFAGWKSSEDQKVYLPGDDVTLLCDVVLTAVWKAAAMAQSAQASALEGQSPQTGDGLALGLYALSCASSLTAALLLATGHKAEREI